jgi:hypothetical protein
MLLRLTPLFFVAFGLMAPAVWAEEKADKANTHEGKILKIAGNKLTMVDKEGKNEHIHTLAPDAKVMCDNKECKIEDLKAGLRVRVTTKPGDVGTAVKVEAFTTEEKK